VSDTIVGGRLRILRVDRAVGENTFDHSRSQQVIAAWCCEVASCIQDLRSGELRDVISGVVLFSELMSDGRSLSDRAR
jgi:hypothetical protein